MHRGYANNSLPVDRDTMRLVGKLTAHVVWGVWMDVWMHVCVLRVRRPWQAIAVGTTPQPLAMHRNTDAGTLAQALAQTNLVCVA